MNNHKCGNLLCQSKSPVFYKDKRTKDGLRSWCKECCSLSSKKYNKIFGKERTRKRKKYKLAFYAIPENREAKNEHARERYKNDPILRKKMNAYSRENHLKRKYGLTIQDWNNLLSAQNNACAICETQFSLENAKHRLYPRVDHNHGTGKVRGLLCNACNTVLGFFKEDIEILTKAQLYLTRNL